MTQRALEQAVQASVEMLEVLLATVRNDDGTVRYKFPGIDITANNNYLLRKLIGMRDIEKFIPHLQFLLRRDEMGAFVLPGMQVPEESKKYMIDLEVL